MFGSDLLEIDHKVVRFGHRAALLYLSPKKRVLAISQTLVTVPGNKASSKSVTP